MKNISRQAKISSRLHSTAPTHFEQWLKTYLDITPNLAQRKVISILESSRRAKLPGRVIIMHALDDSIRTICEYYIYWLHRCITPFSDIAIYYKDGKERIKAKYAFLDLLYAHPEAFNIAPKGIRQPTPTMLASTRYSVARYLTSYNPATVRGSYIRYALFTEANDSTPRLKRKLEYYDKLANSWQALGMLMDSNTMCIMESTPRSRTGAGFFLDTYNSAKKKKNLFTQIFIPWHANEQNTKKLQIPIPDFYRSLDSYEYYLWKQIGCTLEQINWYRAATKNMETQEQKIAQYPSTEQEALNALTADYHKQTTQKSPTPRLVVPQPKIQPKLQTEVEDLNCNPLINQEDTTYPERIAPKELTYQAITTTQTLEESINSPPKN